MYSITKKDNPLLPDRRQQNDFFVCDIFDATPKGDMASMEHPIFSLSTKPDHTIRRYENGKHWIAINPSAYGLATVHDRDILIYCISQVIAALNEDRQVSKVLRFKAYDLLTATNRTTDGRGYSNLKAAMNRLQGTQIETNIKTGGQEAIDIFSLIDRAKIIRETRDGRMLDIEITLSDWVFNAIENKEVLTLNRDYFRLRKPLERRIYEIARKHCGHQKEWSIGIDLLHKKTGSKSNNQEFKRLLKNIVKQDEQHNHIPDYAIEYDEILDKLTFRNRAAKKKEEIKLETLKNATDLPKLQSETYEKARQLAPAFDVYYLEKEWHSFWIDKGRIALKSPDGAFLAFCKKRYERDKSNLL